eukprot:4746013-Ditylum_brightwellii.AAC.1
MTVECPLVGPLNFLNHTCQDHCNLSWMCVSGRRYEVFLNELVRKGWHIIINYYAGDEDTDEVAEGTLECI